MNLYNTITVDNNKLPLIDDEFNLCELELMYDSNNLEQLNIQYFLHNDRFKFNYSSYNSVEISLYYLNIDYMSNLAVKTKLKDFTNNIDTLNTNPFIFKFKDYQDYLHSNSTRDPIHNKLEIEIEGITEVIQDTHSKDFNIKPLYKGFTPANFRDNKVLKDGIYLITSTFKSPSEDDIIINSYNIINNGLNDYIEDKMYNINNPLQFKEPNIPEWMIYYNKIQSATVKLKLNEIIEAIRILSLTYKNK